ncbi:MAG: XisI protein [Symploca sp. SIO2B6]|nr:XisI protein [Symploca sp. SIO2B6]
MATINKKLTQYQGYIQSVLKEYARNKPSNGDFEVLTVFDTERHHYQIVHLGWDNKRWIHHCTIHVDIRNEKFWLFQNLTEHEIERDLMAMGVPKTDIILGFVPENIRHMTDFGVS